MAAPSDHGTISSMKKKPPLLCPTMTLPSTGSDILLIGRNIDYCRIVAQSLLSVRYDHSSSSSSSSRRGVSSAGDDIKRQSGGTACTLLDIALIGSSSRSSSRSSRSSSSSSSSGARDGIDGRVIRRQRCRLQPLHRYRNIDDDEANDTNHCCNSSLHDTTISATLHNALTARHVRIVTCLPLSPTLAQSSTTHQEEQEQQLQQPRIDYITFLLHAQEECHDLSLLYKTLYNNALHLHKDYLFLQRLCIVIILGNSTSGKKEQNNEQKEDEDGRNQNKHAECSHEYYSWKMKNKKVESTCRNAILMGILHGKRQQEQQQQQEDRKEANADMRSNIDITTRDNQHNLTSTIKNLTFLIPIHVMDINNYNDTTTSIDRSSCNGIARMILHGAKIATRGTNISNDATTSITVSIATAGVGENEAGEDFTKTMSGSGISPLFFTCMF